MVMEAQPSPQSVGREFVRQYYTLLNKAPNHLHRFYNNNSSFIHGESTLVIGQKNIHNRIQQLNFRDCHAKISQVDAQATLGNGVVVQVTGELSNDGQPMRRFTQTFVLAAQSPKKFYVHNDIFRYQDLYSDEENDGEARSENDEEHETDPIVTNNTMGVGGDSSSQQQPLQQQQAQVVVPQSSQTLTAQQQPPAIGPQQQQTIYYSMPQNVVAAAPRPVPVIAAQTVPLAQFNAAAGTTGIQAAQLNGVVGGHEDILSGIQQGQANLNQGPSNVVAGSIVPVVATAPPQVLSATAVSVATVGQAGHTQSSVVPAGIANIPVQAASIHSSPPIVQHQQLQQPQQQQGTNVTTGTIAIQQQLTGHPNTPAQLDDENVSNANECNNVSSQQQSQNIASKTDQSPVIDDFKTINEQQQQEKYEAVAAAKQFSTNEPKTYANLFKSNNTSLTNSGSFVSLPSVQNQISTAQQQQQQHQHGHQQKQQQQQQQSSSTNASYTSSSTGYIKNDSSRMENNLQQNNPGGLPQRNNSSRINKDFDQRRTSNANSQQYNDNHQLFLGNVPHHASEEELRALFSRFGQVLDLRIHSKTLVKVQGLRSPQNYGFITYDSPESVMNCLSNCPLFFPENSPDGQQLNVEEKKPRMRNLNDMSSRQSNMSGSNIGGGSSQRGGGGGGGSLSGGRSLSNSGGGGGGGMMRGGGGGNSLSRGSTGPRMSSGFNRNENRGSAGGGTGTGGGQQSRNGNSSNNPSGGNSYGNRR